MTNPNSTKPEPVAVTERLVLRPLNVDDAPFILELLNEQSFLQNIGDKRVRTLDDARDYILTGPVASYEEFGFGLWLVEIEDSSTPIGICGLLKRKVLEDVDIGYAFLPKFWSRGYALESAAATLSFASANDLRRVVAVVNPDNESSIRLLEKLGFVDERKVRLSENEPEINLFAVELNKN
jgi:RimJ/RimL family protein N-acetyltransferase